MLLTIVFSIFLASFLFRKKLQGEKSLFTSFQVFNGQICNKFLIISSNFFDEIKMYLKAATLYINPNHPHNG